MVGSDHDKEAARIPIFSANELRRQIALQMAADTIGVKDNTNAGPIAEQFVAAAKIFEAYLKGN